MNPPPQSAAKRVEPDDDGPQADQPANGPSEFDRFAELTQKLLNVPKTALDKRRAR